MFYIVAVSDVMFFVPDEEMNDEDNFNLTSIRFHHYENISSCYLHKQILPENGKPCTSCMDIRNVNKVKDTTYKILSLKSCRILDFHSEYYIVTCLHP